MENESRTRFHLREADNYSQRQVKTEMDIERELGIDLIGVDPAGLSLKDRLRRLRQLEAALAKEQAVLPTTPPTENQATASLVVSTNQQSENLGEAPIQSIKDEISWSITHALDERLQEILSPQEYWLYEQTQLNNKSIQEISQEFNLSIAYLHTLRTDIRKKIEKLLKENEIYSIRKFDKGDRLAVAANKGRLPALLFMDRYYTFSNIAQAFLEDHIREIDQSLLDEGWILFEDLKRENPLAYSKIHYRYYRRNERGLIHEAGNVLYVKPEVIDFVTAPHARTFKASTLTPPSPGLQRVTEITSTRSERQRLVYGAEKGRITGVKSENGWWWFDESIARQYLQQTNTRES